MPIIPYIPDRTALQLQVLVNGEDKGMHFRLKRIDVTYILNKIPSAKIIFAANNSYLGDKEEALTDELKINDDLVINVVEKGATKTLFKGVVHTLSRKLKPSTGFEVKVECKDLCEGLTAQQDMVPDETFADRADRFITKERVENKLTLSSYGDEKISKVHSTTPWDFIVSYLDSMGFMSTVREGVFSAIDIVAPDEVLAFQAKNGDNIFEFELKESEVAEKIKIQYWDPANQELTSIEEEVQATHVEGIEYIDLGMTLLSEETVMRMAKARAAKNALGSLHGTLRTYGNLTATYGQYLTFDRLDDRLNNTPFLITEERHTIADGNWSTTYAFGLADTKTFAQQIEHLTHTDNAYGGRNNLSLGLQIGTVTQLADDPQGASRILVNLPSISAESEGLWARWASAQAGAERGAFFLPEIGDEVIVGFLNEDTDTPIVLGTLYSSANPPPFAIEDANNVQGIVTREGTRMVLDDEEKAIVIETDAGNTLTVSDGDGGITLADQNGNKIVLSSDGILIESAGNLELKAAIELKTDSAQQSLNASAIMELSGGLIKLN